MTKEDMIKIDGNMNNLDKQYQELLQDIIDNGVTKMDRTGTGTLSVFGRQIRHKMSEGFPLLTTKKMYFKGIVTELLWFLRGDTNIKYLVDNDCHIWDGDAFKNFMNKSEGDPDLIWNQEQFINFIKTDDEFAKKWGDLGRIYGVQWRSWATFNKPKYIDPSTPMSDKMYIDQITNLINDLKTNPDSRRLMVSSWNVGELDQMTLPPCHYGFQVYTRELSLGERQAILEKRGYSGLLHSNVKNYKSHKKILEVIKQTCDDVNLPTRAISLMWNQRSVDTFLGLPFNIASYGLLLEIIAKEVNMVPDELIGNLGDTHLYLNHIEQAKEQIGRELGESERYVMFEDRGYEFRMNDWTREEQYDKAGIPKHTREPYPLPRLDIHPGMLDYELDKLEIDMFKILDYQSHPTIKAPLSN